MSQIVIFMRHGEYEQSLYSEKKGSLTSYGEEVSTQVGFFLAENNYSPKLFVVSNAVRAKETKELVLSSFVKKSNVQRSEIKEIEVPKLNENWDFDPLVEVLSENQDVDCMMIVGHNPIMGALASIVGKASQFKPGSFLIIKYNCPVLTERELLSSDATILHMELM